MTLRPGWDADVRYSAMRAVVWAKFWPEDVRDRLLSTGDALLIEGTGRSNVRHHDQHWGQCYCDQHRMWPGKSWLGRILMETRALLRDDPEDTFARVAVTGHRPQHLDCEQTRFATDELERLAVKLKTNHRTTTAISGMALGADTWWAQAALAAELDVWAYVPFLAQPDRWSRRQQDTWADLLDQASRKLVLADTYDVRLLHARNDFMIRDCDLLVAVYDPRKTTGGTASAVRKAREAGKPVVTVDVEAMRTYRALPG